MTAFDLQAFNAAFQQIGKEAHAVRTIELSMVSALAKGAVSNDDMEEWLEMLIERREYLAKKIDEVIGTLGMTANETLESLRVNRDRRAKR